MEPENCLVEYTIKLIFWAGNVVLYFVSTPICIETAVRCNSLVVWYKLTNWFDAILFWSSFTTKINTKENYMRNENLDKYLQQSHNLKKIWCRKHWYFMKSNQILIKVSNEVTSLHCIIKPPNICPKIFHNNW